MPGKLRRGSAGDTSTILFTAQYGDVLIAGDGVIPFSASSPAVANPGH